MVLDYIISILEYVEPDLPPKYEELSLPHQQVPQGIIQNESATSIQLRNETIERDFKEIDELYKKLIQKLNIIDSELQSDSLDFTKDIEQIKGHISFIEKESNGLKENIIGTTK